MRAFSLSTIYTLSVVACSLTPGIARACIALEPVGVFPEAISLHPPTAHAAAAARAEIPSSANTPRATLLDHPIDLSGALVNTSTVLLDDDGIAVTSPGAPTRLLAPLGIGESGRFLGWLTTTPANPSNATADAVVLPAPR